MKISLVIVLIIWSEFVFSQTKSKSNFEHQLEYGISYFNLMNPNSKINGFGIIYSDQINASSNYYFGYKATVNHKHLFRLNYTHFESKVSFPELPNLGLWGLSYSTIHMGYAYLFTPKQLIFERFNLSMGGQLSYRYKGGEGVVFGYRDPTSPLSEPVFGNLNYNSFGFSPHGEIEYLISKHFRLGVILNLNYYPFENAKLKGDGTNEPAPSYVQIYKPNNLNFTATFKIGYNFNILNK